jgi:hypothetical protein
VGQLYNGNFHINQKFNKMKKILFLIVILSSIVSISQTIGGGSGGNTIIPNESITNEKIASGISKIKVGLSNVDNTSDLLKPISTATQTVLDLKVDKAIGKSLVLDSEITRLGTLSNYTHPTTHPASIIEQDSNNRFVTDAERTKWNSSEQAVAPSISTKISSYTMTGSDSTVLFDTTESPITVTLPIASTVTGRIFYIRKNDDGYNSLTFSPSLKVGSGEVSSLNYARTLKIQSDGINWVLID